MKLDGIMPIMMEDAQLNHLKLLRNAGNDDEINIEITPDTINNKPYLIEIVVDFSLNNSDFISKEIGFIIKAKNANYETASTSLFDFLSY